MLHPQNLISAAIGLTCKGFCRNQRPQYAGCISGKSDLIRRGERFISVDCRPSACSRPSWPLIVSAHEKWRGVKNHPSPSRLCTRIVFPQMLDWYSESDALFLDVIEGTLTGMSRYASRLRRLVQQKASPGAPCLESRQNGSSGNYGVNRSTPNGRRNRMGPEPPRSWFDLATRWRGYVRLRGESLRKPLWVPHSHWGGRSVPKLLRRRGSRGVQSPAPQSPRMKPIP